MFVDSSELEHSSRLHGRCPLRSDGLVCCGFSPTAVWQPANALAMCSTRLANRLAPRRPNVAFPPFGHARGPSRHQSVTLDRLVAAAPVCHHHELSSIRSRMVLWLAVPSMDSTQGWSDLACPGCLALTPPHELSQTPFSQYHKVVETWVRHDQADKS